MVYIRLCFSSILIWILWSRLMITKEDKIKFIVEQEKLANNSWKWIKKADDKTINDLYDYWTQEL